MKRLNVAVAVSALLLVGSAIVGTQVSAAARQTFPIKKFTFNVLFSTDDAKLSPEALGAIARVVQTAKVTKTAHIVVTGYGDMTLSDRRAAAVKAEMVRLGFNANDIATVGKSATEAPKSADDEGSGRHLGAVIGDFMLEDLDIHVLQ